MWFLTRQGWIKTKAWNPLKVLDMTIWHDMYDVWQYETQYVTQWHYYDLNKVIDVAVGIKTLFSFLSYDFLFNLNCFYNLYGLF